MFLNDHESVGYERCLDSQAQYEHVLKVRDLDKSVHCLTVTMIDVNLSPRIIHGILVQVRPER